MAKEIEKESEKLIAEGDSEYIKAQSMTDRQRAEIISKAVEEAAVIKLMQTQNLSVFIRNPYKKT